MPHQRQYLMQASDEYEMNEWITLINYASAFKTAGIRMRASTMDKDKAVLTGAAAAASHKREVQGTAMTHGSGTSTPKSLGTGLQRNLGLQPALEPTVELSLLRRHQH
jgi:hypothetical protein